MAYIDKNGIQFTTFDSNGSAIGKKIQNIQNQGATIDDLSEIAQDNNGDLPSIINALEIDWNGARPAINEDNNGIQSTGELLKIIKIMYDDINQINAGLATIVNAIALKLSEQEYYWYVGTSNPASMTSYSPAASNNSTGWRVIGTDIPQYNENNMLWNGDDNNIRISRNYIYVALPSNSLGIYNILKNNEIGTTWIYQGTCTIENITYYIYKSNFKLLSFSHNIY